MTSDPGSALRQRMIDDMVARKLVPNTQRGRIFACKKFAAYLGVTTAVARKLKRRSTVEPVIGHMKSEHRMDRNQTLVFSYGRRER